MSTPQFLEQAAVGRVRIQLVDGQQFTGRFRTDILCASALSAYFYGDVRDLSLPISNVAAIEPLS